MKHDEVIAYLQRATSTDDYNPTLAPGLFDPMNAKIKAAIACLEKDGESEKPITVDDMRALLGDFEGALPNREPCLFIGYESCILEYDDPKPHRSSIDGENDADFVAIVRATIARMIGTGETEELRDLLREFQDADRDRRPLADGEAYIAFDKDGYCLLTHFGPPFASPFRVCADRNLEAFLKKVREAIKKWNEDGESEPPRTKTCELGEVHRRREGYTYVQFVDDLGRVCELGQRAHRSVSIPECHLGPDKLRDLIAVLTRYDKMRSFAEGTT